MSDLRVVQRAYRLRIPRVEENHLLVPRCPAMLGFGCREATGLRAHGHRERTGRRHVDGSFSDVRQLFRCRGHDVCSSAETSRTTAHFAALLKLMARCGIDLNSGGHYELYTPRKEKWHLQEEARPFWADAEDEILGIDNRWRVMPPGTGTMHVILAVSDHSSLDSLPPSDRGCKRPDGHGSN